MRQPWDGSPNVNRITFTAVRIVTAVAFCGLLGAAASSIPLAPPERPSDAMLALELAERHCVEALTRSIVLRTAAAVRQAEEQAEARCEQLFAGNPSAAPSAPAAKA